MKVYLGSYRNRLVSKIYTRYMEKKYGYDYPDASNTFEKILEKMEDTLQSFYNRTINKYLGRERKIRVRIDNYDVWSLDETLSTIIHPALIKLKEQKQGAPYTDDEDVPEELRSYNAPPKENNYDPDGHHFKRWDWIIDEMIWAFEQNLIGWESQYESGKSDLVFVKSDTEGFSELKEGPNHTLKYDCDGMKKHEERMKNGRRLFAKYYHDLWD
jgi:hypothetical protein